MRYLKIGMVLFAGSALAACSRSGNSDGEAGARVAVADSAGSEQVPRGHDQHAAQAPAAGEPAATGMSTTDHSAMGHGDMTGAGAAVAPDAGPAHAGVHGGTGQATQPTMARAGHEGGAAAQHSGDAAHAQSTAGADHTAHAAAPAPVGGQPQPAGGHAAHATEATQAAPAVNAVHATHEAEAPQTAQVGDAGHAAHAAAAGTAARPSDEGTALLLTLARELVRDPVVQRQIQEDPALRKAWEDPGIRAVILQQP